jgi:hypothetical protein
MTSTYNCRPCSYTTTDKSNFVRHNKSKLHCRRSDILDDKHLDRTFFETFYNNMITMKREEYEICTTWLMKVCSKNNVDLSKLVGFDDDPQILLHDMLSLMLDDKYMIQILGHSIEFKL